MTEQQALVLEPAPAVKSPDPARFGYFLDITLTNVRCFGPEPQCLKLCDSQGRPAQWTVLVGNNGTGKTTLLQCLTGFESARAGSEPALTFPRFLASPRANLIRARSTAAVVESTVAVAVASSLTSPDQPIEPYKFKFAQGANGVKTSYFSATATLLCYAYGASRRVSDVSSMRSLGLDGDATASLFSDDAPLVDAEEWLLRLDYSASKPSPIQARQVERRGQVIELLKRILPDVDDIRFTQPTGDRPTPTVEFLTPYGWVPLRALGHGYRALIAWMVDVAGRMVERYPDSPNPLSEPAIVLVDEIDLHLHPTWQRKLIGHLTRLFPNTQFVATAHSPLIVQAAGSGNIAVLRREGDHVVIENNIEAIRGWRVDQILTSGLFDLPTARPPEFDEKLARRVQLLSQPTLSDADQREVAKLEDEIGVLPTGETGDDAKRMLRIIEETHQLIKKYGG